MNQTDQARRFKITFFILGVTCMILLPTIFYYGIFGVLTLVFSAVTLHYLIAAFRSRARRNLRWGFGGRFLMSRLSCLIVGALFGCLSTFFVIHIFFKTTDTQYLTIAFIALAALSVVSRWLDLRRAR